MKKVMVIGVGLFLLFIGASIADRSYQPDNIRVSQQIDKKVQQEEFLKLYRIALSGIKISNTLFYSSHNLLDKADRATMYDFLKSSEDKNSQLTINFKTVSTDINKTHPSLKEYRNDIAQSFDELTDVFAHRQIEAKYLADYLNTGDLESYRKAKNEIEGTGETMSNAVSRLIFGVGEKIGIDTKTMEEEYQKIDVEVKQDFEKRFDKL
ncbi:MAG: hypothetical protein WCT85_00895 [Parachlamydiales bacterium]|jgi:hypothetical protein